MNEVHMTLFGEGTSEYIDHVPANIKFAKMAPNRGETYSSRISRVDNIISLKQVIYVASQENLHAPMVIANRT
jgi:hypothetical protein